MNTLHMKNARHRIAGSWLILCLVALSGVPFVAAAGETLGYDLKGNIISRQSASGTTDYQYDSLDRLVNEQGPQATQGFTYDANGNRLTDGGGGYTYAPASNVMATEHGNPVVHDAAGNMIDDGQGMTFEYNQAGRLKRVYQNSTLVATYTYNALGQRTRKVTPTGTTVYHYDLDGQLIEETLADGSPQTTYVWRGSKPTAVIYQPGTPSNSTAQEKVVYLHTDHLETPRSATDDARTTVWRWESDAFGSTAADADPDGDSNLTEVNLRFPGQFFDQETNLHYNLNRFYNPVVSRYTSHDLIQSDDINHFIYAGNNPLLYYDPKGLLKIKVIREVVQVPSKNDPHKWVNKFVYKYVVTPKSTSNIFSWLTNFFPNGFVKDFARSSSRGVAAANALITGSDVINGTRTAEVDFDCSPDVDKLIENELTKNNFIPGNSWLYDGDVVNLFSGIWVKIPDETKKRWGIKQPGEFIGLLKGSFSTAK